MRATVVLVADDEPETRKYLRVNLVARGYQVVEAATGEEAVNGFAKRRVDLVLLDVLMPGLDGYDVCSRIRKSSDVPIVFLTGRAAERDLVRAFDIGADDYLTKPFGVAELMARVRAALRRVNSDGLRSDHPRVFGDLIVDIAGRRVWKHGREVQLTGTEFAIIALFAKNADRALTHRYILDKVWGEAYEYEKQYVRAYVYRLRAKLEDRPELPVRIVGIPGVGYMLTSRYAHSTDRDESNAVPAYDLSVPAS